VGDINHSQLGSDPCDHAMDDTDELVIESEVAEERNGSKGHRGAEDTGGPETGLHHYDR